MWSDVLDGWSNGKVLVYPKNRKNRFQWNTSVLRKNSKFKQSFKTDTFPSVQDFSPFLEHIEGSKNKYVVSFPNLGKDAILVIPQPRKNKNFATLKDFIDNASLKQQQEFWKETARIAKQMLSDVYISTSGHGVNYLHVRISKKPKYYFDEKLINV